MHLVDREKKASRWARATMRPTALVAAGALSFGGLVAATTSGSQAQQPSVDSAAETPAARRSTVLRALICNPDPPEYPGCTMSQIASLEVGTKKKAKRSYKAMRWGQKRDDFKKVSPRANRILKRAWRHARADWVARHPGQRLAIGSWRAFRHNLAYDGCALLGFMSSVSFWCHFDHVFQEKVVDNANRVINGATLACGGAALAASVGSGIVRVLKLVAVTWRQAVAAGIYTCIGALYSKYFTNLYN